MFEQLKKPIIFYVLSGVLLSVIVLLNLTIDKYDSFLQEVSKKLINVEANLSSMEAASREIDTLLTRTNNYLPPDFYESSTEGKIFSAFDNLKARMNLADVSASKIVDNADAMSLPLKITGSLKNYTEVVNNTGYLRSLKFPFFEITSITLSKKQDKDGESVVYIIEGGLHMPKKDPGPVVEVKKDADNSSGSGTRQRRKW